jgi:hypothetical protein
MPALTRAEEGHGNMFDLYFRTCELTFLIDASRLRAAPQHQ